MFYTSGRMSEMIHLKLEYMDNKGYEWNAYKNNYVKTIGVDMLLKNE